MYFQHWKKDQKLIITQIAGIILTSTFLNVYINEENSLVLNKLHEIYLVKY